MEESEERRKKAEEEIKKAFRSSCDYISEHLEDEFKGKITTITLKNLVEERLSEDIKNQYMDIIYSYLNKITSYALELDRVQNEFLRMVGER